MQRYIFLDFDGVICTQQHRQTLLEKHQPLKDDLGPYFDPEAVANLRAIVDSTDASIVVTSSWKEYMAYEAFLDMWMARGLPGFVTDVTPTVSRKRGDEIDAWLDECDRDCQYVIIDDLDGSNFNEHQLSRLLVVNPYNGLDDVTMERAIALLNQKG